MTRCVAAALLVLSALRLQAQKIDISGVRIPLPAGNVLGVALDEGQGMFFVQQSVLSPGASGRGINSHLAATIPSAT